MSSNNASRRPISKNVEEILCLCLDHDIEIVSYGLAPNPNGFCYEAPENASSAACRRLSSLLDALTKKETIQLLNESGMGPGTCGGAEV